MLRKCYEYAGRRYTLTGEVHRQVRVRTGRTDTPAHAYTRAQVYTRVGELGKLRAASWAYTRVGELKSYIKEEETNMFYVVDEQEVYIDEFTTREEAEKFCEKWNTSLRFNEWGEQKAHIIKG